MMMMMIMMMMMMMNQWMEWCSLVSDSHGEAEIEMFVSF